MSELLSAILNNDAILVSLTSIVTAGLTTLFIYLRGKAKESETKLDDNLVKAIEEALANSKDKETND